MIITNDDAKLRVFCEPVLPEEVALLVEQLEKELEYSGRLGRAGIGLAAPQIGIAKNIAIVRLPKINFNLVNAKLVTGYDPALFTEEGCLSFPGRMEDTIRFQEVYITNGVEPYSFTATGLVAVVCQHELDHLNSTLFMDRKVLKPVPTVRNTTKTGPNESCPCASGKKYKKCCGR
jgi:peptide deformylase